VVPVNRRLTVILACLLSVGLMRRAAQECELTKRTPASLQQPTRKCTRGANLLTDGSHLVNHLRGGIGERHRAGGGDLGLPERKPCQHRRERDPIPPVRTGASEAGWGGSLAGMR
jgi:hypothetical protein